MPCRGQLPRQLDDRAKATLGQVEEHHFSAVRASTGTRNRQSESHASLGMVSGTAALEERFEDPLEHVGGQSRSLVVDLDADAVVDHEANPGVVAVTHCVVDQVAHRALQADRPGAVRMRRMCGQRHVTAQGTVLVHHLLEHRLQVDVLHAFALCIVLGEAQGLLRHLPHTVECARHEDAQRVVFHHLDAQPQRRDRRTKVVADGGEQLRAVVDEAGELVLHQVESSRHLACLAGSGDGERLDALAAADALRGQCQGLDPDTTLVKRLPMVWIGSKDFAVRRGEELPLALLEAPCAFREPGIEALDRARRRWRLAFSSPSLAGLWAASSAGLGITIRTTLGLPPQLAVLGRSNALPKLPDIALSLYTAKASPTPAVARLREILLDELAAATL